MKKIIYSLYLILISQIAFSQSEGDVIINEIGNSGTKKKLYTGGDFVELIVLKEEGVKLAGWYLTDLSGPGGTPKETEGYIKFSDKEGSIFNEILPKGTYILICLGSDRERYGDKFLDEDVDLSDNTIVVYAYHSEKHMEPVEGTINLTGKDNIALVSKWDKKSTVDVVTWGGAINWLARDITELQPEALENGMVVYFKPTTKDFSKNYNPIDWVSTTDLKEITPGKKNPGVDDSWLIKK